MNRRKEQFNKGLRNLSRKRTSLYAIRPTLCDSKGRLETNQIIASDSIKLLDASPDGWADLVFADPPFNIGYLYDGYDDSLPTEEYLEFSRRWMRAVHRVLKQSGSFYLAIGDDYAAELCVIAKRELGFNLRNWIIWHYTFGQQPRNKFARSHTHILYFTKDAKDFTFNADAIRVASARQTTYADARANPKGKLPDDVWFLRPQEAGAPHFDTGCDTWNVSRVCGTFKEREGWHGCQMPIGILDRIVRSSSHAGDIILDPFNGSGTTVVSAALLGRRYVGIDQSEAYVSFARQRLAQALQRQISSVAGSPSTNGPQPMAGHRSLTRTDSLGRPRAPRRARKLSA